MEVESRVQNDRISTEKYIALRSEYGNHFEKLSAADRSLILSVLGISLYNSTLKDPSYHSLTVYNQYEALMSDDAKKCCVSLMDLKFEHMACACTALLSQLNLPHE